MLLEARGRSEAEFSASNARTLNSHLEDLMKDVTLYAGFENVVETQFSPTLLGCHNSFDFWILLGVAFAYATF